MSTLPFSNRAPGPCQVAERPGPLGLRLRKWTPRRAEKFQDGANGATIAAVGDDGKLTLRCPECSADLVIDRATGEVLFHKAARQPAADGKDFDSLFADLDASKERADEVFEREVSAYKDRDRLLEEKFKEAMEKAKEAPDEELPPRPWELD